MIDAPEGAVFLQVLKMNGYSLVCCNGKGTCGRCRIRFCGNGAPLPGAADRIAFPAEQLRWRIPAGLHEQSTAGLLYSGKILESRQVEAVTAYKGRDYKAC